MKPLGRVGCWLHNGWRGIGGKLTVESDFTATRVGDLDVSSVTPEEPIHDEGEPIDPAVVE